MNGLQILTRLTTEDYRRREVSCAKPGSSEDQNVNGAAWRSLWIWSNRLRERERSPVTQLQPASGEGRKVPAAGGSRPDNGARTETATSLEQAARKAVGHSRASQWLTVLGNGPSLAGTDLSALNADTVGMNAAYRYWAQIGWYPTYYACLDPVVIESHHQEIAALITDRANNGIRLFFLRRKILKLQPKLKDHPAVLVFDDWVKDPWLAKFGPITTGAGAALLGLILGYRHVRLLGIDLNYVERVDGAEHAGGTVLTMQRTPEHNPNYFFADYQREGDRFQIPNPKPGVHQRSWAAFARIAERVGARVENGNPWSALDRFPVVPQVPRAKAVAARARPRQELSLGAGEPIFGDNWHRVQGNREGPFRWSGPGRDSSLHLPLDRSVPLTLLMLVRIFRRRLLGGFQIEADGRALDVHVMERDGLYVVAAQLPAAETSAPTELKLRLRTTLVPAQENPKSDDERAIGLGLHRIQAFPASAALTAEAPLCYFDGLSYLEAHPDVADAVERGQIATALEHYQKFGQREQRAQPFALTRGPNYGSIRDLCRLDRERQRAEDLQEWHREIRQWANGRFQSVFARAAEVENVLSARVQSTADRVEQAERLLGDRAGVLETRLGDAETALRQAAQDREELRADLGQRFDALEARKADRGALDAAVSRLDDAETGLRQAAQDREELRADLGQRFDALEARKADSGALDAAVSRLDDAETGLRQAAQGRDELRADLGQRFDALEARKAEADALDAAFSRLDQALTDVSTRLQQAKDELARDLRREIQGVREETNDRLGRSADSKAVDLVEAKIDSLGKQLDQRSEMAELRASQAVSAAQSEMRTLDEAVKQVRKSVDKIRSGQEELGGRIEEVQEQTDWVRNPRINVRNNLGYQHFRRVMAKSDINRFLETWSSALHIELNQRELFYLGHRLCQIEDVCRGRLAADTNGALLRGLVARAAVRGQQLSVLEIGTLFGIGIAGIHEVALPVAGKPSYTVIDPFDGYYGRTAGDIATGVPVTKSVFQDNMRRAGVPARQVTVVKGLSTDAKVIDKMQGTQFDLLVIDGDHSYEGVKNDVENYTACIRDGGYLIVDDYGNESWPDVQSYVDRHVMPREDLEYLGCDWNTAVFRVRRS